MHIAEHNDSKIEQKSDVRLFPHTATTNVTGPSVGGTR